MKLRSERKSLERLSEIKFRLTHEIKSSYEHRAKSCEVCETPGACCLDAHFVNVRISRLEAVAINNFIDGLPKDRAVAVRERVETTISKYNLNEDADDVNRYACPLFERSVGCLIHDVGKPIPCVVHACYESAEDIPPPSIADDAEIAVDRLNVQTYGRPKPVLPIPLAIKKWWQRLN